MGSNIENKIKETFQNREIQPSTNAWEKLESKLIIKETKKEKNKFRFIAYAAIFIGLLFGLLFFLKNEDVKNQNIENPVVIDDKKPDTQIEKNIELNETIINKEKVIVQNDLQKIKKQTTKKTPHLKKNNLINQPVLNEITQNKSNKKISEESLEIEKINLEHVSEQIVVQKNEDKIAKDIIVEKIDNKPIKNKLRDKITTNDDEIESLLAAAMNTTTKEKKYKLTVNSNSLQYSVESELNKPLTNKIFKTLKIGVDTMEAIIVSNNN